MSIQPGYIGEFIRKVRDVSLLRTGLLAGAALFGSCSASFAATCEHLLAARLPDVTINGAELIPAGTYRPPGSPKAFSDLPSFCRVTATVTPVPDSSIRIEVWLPEKTWNGRYQQVGNHGWGSGIYWSEMAPQLQRGFATGATDDGHPGSPSDPFNVGWTFGHPVKIDDMAFRAVHRLAENAKLLIAAFYGRHESKAYFNGCSDGGREGLREAYDFPSDFNGILIGGVASYWTHAATQQLVATTNFADAGITGPRGDAVLTLALNAVTKACDANDHVSDGVISSPRQCHWNPYTLVCKPGQDAASCITFAQAGALLANLYPVRDPQTGKWLFSGFERGSEFDQIRFRYYSGLAPFGVANYKIAFGNPAYDGMAFDLHTDLPKLDKALGIMNMTDPDLRRFAAAGGKLIQYHGWGDAAFTPGWEIRYYKKVVDSIGHGNLRDVQDFYRLFMMPGVGHCGGGPGPDNIGAENSIAVSHDPEHDAVVALMDWTEHGVLPRKFVATKFNAAGDRIALQRPICAYPARAVWNGSGDTNYAASFHCAEPASGLGSLNGDD